MTKNQQRVSIIMNCYNSSRFLREAIESVISQTYQNWELIFWDNQSTDDSAKIFKEYNDERCKYFLATIKTDLSEARNLAIEKAEGYWLAFLDCDDIWETNKLDLQINSFNNNDKVAIIYSPFELILNTRQKNNSLLNFLTNKVSCKPHPPEKIFNRLLEGNFIIFSSVLIKRDVFIETGGFSKNLVHNEDYEILLKSSYRYLAICISEKTVKYRIHDSNNSYANGEISYLENDNIYKQFSLTTEIENAINNNRTRFSFYKIRNGHFFDGIGYFFKQGSFVSAFKIIKKRFELKIKSL
jgi:glycosyltransferase involved in cell wall biosynthesis